MDASVQVLSVVASLLPWPLYHKLLNQLMANVIKTNAPTKGTFRALCSVIDAFHFEQRSNTSMQGALHSLYLCQESLKTLDEDTADVSEEDDETESNRTHPLSS